MNSLDYSAAGKYLSFSDSPSVNNKIDFSQSLSTNDFLEHENRYGKRIHTTSNSIKVTPFIDQLSFLSKSTTYSFNASIVEKNELDIKLCIKNIMQIFKNTDYEEGFFTTADTEIERFSKSHSNENLIKLLNHLAIDCMSGTKTKYPLNFLNLIKNLQYKSSLIPRDYISNVFAFLSMADLSIKEAAISTFECLDNINPMDAGQFADILEKIDTSASYWINNYRLDVINDLKSEAKDS
jgi:hypothetical protein